MFLRSAIALFFFVSNFALASLGSELFKELPADLKKRAEQAAEKGDNVVVQLIDKDGIFSERTGKFLKFNPFAQKGKKIDGFKVITIERARIANSPKLRTWISKFMIGVYPTTLVFDKNQSLYLKLDSLEEWEKSGKSFEEFLARLRFKSEVRSNFIKESLARETMKRTDAWRQTDFEDGKPLLVELIPVDNGTANHLSSRFKNVSTHKIHTIEFDPQNLLSIDGSDDASWFFAYSKRKTRSHTFVVIGKDGALLTSLNPFNFLQEHRSNNGTAWGPIRYEDLKALEKEIDTRVEASRANYRQSYCGIILGSLE